ncbi:hypothetical protein SGRA_3133 [Saprospira grandis str. Lewin]|uniref:Uncharacterized protein n=1 Tax=Saprospira grandis (strain Lewin) TaxID=984262 RepID=H6KZT5_SAPGL|nr:hypothetical protein SGRA_3133 [Saprospira grandis str. Lewin]
MRFGQEALLVQKKGSLEEGLIKGAKLEFCAFFWSKN